MFDGPLLGTLGCQMEEPAEHLQVLPAGEDLVDRGVLADQGAAAVRPDQRGEDPDGGRLAATIGAEQAVDRAAATSP
jgi:hypothetical protein